MDPRTTPKRLKSKPTWLINQLSTHAHRVIDERLRAANIAHRSHYSLLAALAESGPTSQADLGRRIGLDRSDVTAAVNELERQGALERAADPADRRRNVVSITPAGQEQLDAMDVQLGEAQDELLAPLSAAERAELIRMLTALLGHHAPTD